MSDEQRALLTRIQQIGLTMDDLRIYLDNYTDDSFAIQRFNMAAQERQQLVCEYGAKFGPLTGTCPQQQSEDQGWQWGNTDFPWDH